MEKQLIEVSTTVQASETKVWQYWTEPQHIMQWNNASPDWHTPQAENDLKIGGKFNYRMEAKDGSFGFDFWGIYTLINPLQKIEYTMGDERIAKIEFIKLDNSVKIVEIFEAESTNSIELQQQGWQAILNNFKNYVESSN